jgi:hypothetical protein
MGRSLGYDGRSCADNIREIVGERGLISFAEMTPELTKRGAWSENNVAQQAMASIVNLPPARLRWNSTPFLFLRPDGRFELFDPLRHPATVE